jgi:hypothetical protein
MLTNTLYLLQQNIQHLPIELQHHILSYTYSPQPKHLLEDIQNYSETKEYLYEIIEEVDTRNAYYFITAKDEIHNELCNFIYYYLCDGTLEMVHAYFWRRYIIYGLNTDKFISHIIFGTIYIYPIDYKINFIWALLLPEERYAFLDFYSNEYAELFEEDEEDEEDYDY